MAVKESKRLGLGWGSKCSICCMLMCGVYLVISLAYTLVMRLYIKAYYNSAHVAALSVLVATFVIAHHICQVRKSQGCCIRLFAATQTCLNIIYLLCSTVLAIGYIIISVLSIHTNFDYIIGAVFGGINVLWLIYLLITTCAALKRDRYMDYEVDVQFVWHSDNIGGITTDMELFGYPAYGDITSTTKSLDKSSMGTNASLVNNSYYKKSHSCNNCKKCCRILWNICFTVVHFFTHVIIIVIFALSACHPVFTAADTFQYRDSGDLYTVNVPGHRPLSLYMKCRGNGNETIVYENGLGSMAMMAWDFIPKILSDRYKVCISDRRGYGWSETYENDNISILPYLLETQWSETNSDFFAELVKKAEISTPFYYIGHSYGGHHLVQVALNYPDLVKSLIFLDSSHFSAVDSFENYLEAVVNFNAMGIIYILTQTNWYDISLAFADVVEFESLTSEVRKQVTVAFRTGYYFESYFRELQPLKNDELAYKGIEKALENKQINISCYVIDANSFNPNWFPKHNFPKYNESYHYSYVPGASHSFLTLSKTYGNKTSELIDTYIKYDLGVLDESELKVKINSIIAT